MKIPFDIKYRPQIESGEYKVETRNGHPVRIVCYDRKHSFPIMALATEADGHESYIICNSDGRYDRTNDYSSDLFLITPEPELSEFEQEVRVCVTKNLTTHIKDGNGREMSSTVFIDDDTAKKLATELLNLARKELCEQIVDHTKEAYENGKAEALKDLPRWRVTDKPIYGGMYIVRKKYDGLVEHSVSMVVQEGDEYILFNELEKIPGFNE